MSEGAVRRFWKAYSRPAQFAGFAAAIALAVAIPFIQTPLCSVPEQDRNTAAYRVTIDRENPKQTGPTSGNPTVKKYAVNPVIDGSKREIDRIEATYYAPQKKENWGRRYWCDVNATDYFLVLFTLALAVSTFLLWRETSRSIEAAKASVEAVKMTEMARIMVTRISLCDMTTGEDKPPKFRVHYRNFGKTPGFIHRTILHFNVGQKGTPIEDLAQSARGGFYDNGFSLPPTEKDKTALDQYGSKPILARDFNDLMAPKPLVPVQLFVWGEVLFSPVFDEIWVSGFAYRVDLSPGAEQKCTEVGGAAYWRFYKSDR
jgi:hypothetical protein